LIRRCGSFSPFPPNPVPRKTKLCDSWHDVERLNGKVDPFPGLDMRKVDMAAYNDARETLDKRQLQYYRILGDMPSVGDDPNMHATAHLYASDRNGLFPVSSTFLRLYAIG
jgi:hypothetical protein